MSAPTALPTYPPNFGYQLNWWLYGIFTMQVYSYHTQGFKDGLTIKTLVYGSFLIETVQICIATRDSYHQLVLAFGNPAAVAEAYYTWLTMPVCVGIISMMTQLFYAYRIYILSQIRVLAGFIALLSVTQGAAAIAAGLIVVTANSKDVGSNTTNDLAPVMVWLVLSVVCDVAIFSAMTWILSTRRTGFQNMNSVINKIIMLTVETGMASAACAITVLILFNAYKSDIYYALPAVMLSKIYSNSLLVILNNRRTSGSEGTKSHLSSNGPTSSMPVRTTVNEFSPGRPSQHFQNFTMVHLPARDSHRSLSSTKPVLEPDSDDIPKTPTFQSTF
ncbi:hypothetical protein CONPUDRAFT_90905 [Coniophora puteana RWD-64-598 SS2]|uniref:DUF6534 domain-containing protein n=1 Tax=Coniophora puteana (strain RWD-64-598) TaxID=741705 RepID=A0A5M3ML32_CONPW|nr:uncharacterized protein CONPUDRAFT_90905 [Coniophora puteana RWD-64-598 SS2]EIW79524.1 hypothetical protein CONPUDRAFT_90905 [Coniophora puteana RWD-64-598 SS2]